MEPAARPAPRPARSLLHGRLKLHLLIANLGVDAPLTQSFFAYLLLNLVYVPIVLRRRQKLQIAWYWYLALAFIDVQGNYLGEYRHHTVTLSPGKFFLLQLITI